MIQNISASDTCCEATLAQTELLLIVYPCAFKGTLRKRYVNAFPERSIYGYAEIQ